MRSERTAPDISGAQIVRVIALLAACVIAGCAPSKEKISEASVAALEQMLANTPETKDLGLVVQRVTLVTVEANKIFEGTALISKGDERREIPIHVIADDEHVLVTPDPAALGLFLGVDPQFAQLEQETEAAMAEINAAAAELDVTDPNAGIAATVAGSPGAQPAGGPGIETVPSGRFRSATGNTLLVLPTKGREAVAVLQLGVGSASHCVEGDVSCMTISGSIHFEAEDARWMAGDASSPCQIDTSIRSDELQFSSPEDGCKFFGSANSRLRSGLGESYRLDTTMAGVPSFSCEKAVIPTEKMICATPVLGFLDWEMAREFALHLAGSADKAVARREQREWIAERDRCADEACVLQAYLDRLYRIAEPAAE